MSTLITECTKEQKVTEEVMTVDNHDDIKKENVTEKPVNGDDAKKTCSVIDFEEDTNEVIKLNNSEDNQDKGDEGGKKEETKISYEEDINKLTIVKFDVEKNKYVVLGEDDSDGNDQSSAVSLNIHYDPPYDFNDIRRQLEGDGPSFPGEIWGCIKSMSYHTCVFTVLFILTFVCFILAEIYSKKGKDVKHTSISN